MTVQEVIPHRPPFLLIDSIIAAARGEFAVSTRHVLESDPVFSGHFPGFAVYPGVLVLENMAQTACYVLASEDLAADAGAEKPLYVLARVNQCTFSRMVRPGEQLRTEARLIRRVAQFAQFSCESQANGAIVAKADLLVASR